MHGLRLLVCCKMRYAEILIDLIKSNGYSSIAEIGVYKCRGLKKVLRNTDCITNYWAIDNWDPSVLGLSQQVCDNMYTYACSLMTWFSQLKVLRMSSKCAAGIVRGRMFDLVFIDASHDYNSVKEDIELWYPLIRDGGVISGHDYNPDRKDGRYAGLIEAVDERFSGTLIISEDGVWYSGVA